MISPGAGKASSSPLMGNDSEPTIFEYSHRGRKSWSFADTDIPDIELDSIIPPQYQRQEPLELVEMSERDIVAHFTRLSQRNYAVDVGAYPLGSCTMKYNPKIFDYIATLAGVSAVHPATPASSIQGWLELMVNFETSLCEITGMAAATLQPAAGAAGEMTGLLLMRAWHNHMGQNRKKVLIPDSAHGTNPASVRLGGYEVVTVPSNSKGLVDLEVLKDLLDEDVAGIMLTNPNTLGLYEEEIAQIAKAVHEVGGLLYYDGANLNAILGVIRPGDMGFDIVHVNVHKTFATPHGGGGPGAGPVAVSEKLIPFLPGPRPVRLENDSVLKFGWQQMPSTSIGRLHSWHGNAVVIARAYGYLLANGAEGLRKVANTAVLNANWLRHRLRGIYEIPFDRPNMHEFIASIGKEKRKAGLHAMDVAKMLLEQGFHAPTINFPLIVEEALMIEPTETESPQTLEQLAQAFEQVAKQMQDSGTEIAHQAPRNTPVRRLDEARAARKLIQTWDANQTLQN